MCVSLKTKNAGAVIPVCSHLTQLFGLCRGEIVLAASTEKYPFTILLLSFILRPTILRKKPTRYLEKCDPDPTNQLHTAGT